MDFDAEFAGLKRRLAALENQGGTGDTSKIIGKLAVDLDPNGQVAEAFQHMARRVQAAEHAIEDIRRALAVDGPVMAAIGQVSSALDDFRQALDSLDTRMKAAEGKIAALQQPSMAEPATAAFEGSPVGEVARHPEIAPTAAPEARAAIQK